MKTHSIFLAFFFILIQSCSDNQSTNNNKSSKEDKTIMMSAPKRSLDEIKNEVLNGNLNSYEELREIYFDFPPESILFWALYVANKYDYPQAYLDVFNCLVISEVGNISNISKMNPKSKSMAIEYLKLSADKGNSEAKSIIELLSSKLE